MIRKCVLNWAHRCTRVENPREGVPDVQGFQEKLPGKSPYFGCYCIFINKFLPGGAVSSRLTSPVCIYDWASVWHFTLFDYFSFFSQVHKQIALNHIFTTFTSLLVIIFLSFFFLTSFVDIQKNWTKLIDVFRSFDDEKRKTLASLRKSTSLQDLQTKLLF